MLAACLRLMATAKLYEVDELSHERAAELEGHSWQGFLASLSQQDIPALLDDLADE